MTPWIERIFPFLSLVLLGIGGWCLASRRRAIKQVIGLNIMMHGALLAILDGGVQQGSMELAQSVIISALVVEAISLAITLALVVNVYRFHPEGLVDDLNRLKG